LTAVLELFSLSLSLSLYSQPSQPAKMCNGLKHDNPSFVLHGIHDTKFEEVSNGMRMADA
jgi:hypothetical protein